MKTKLFVVAIISCLAQSAYSVPTLIAGDGIFCEADNKTQMQIEITKMGNHPREGQAQVTIGDVEGTVRSFSGADAKVIEARDWLHIDLRTDGKMYARINVRDSVVYGREVSGYLDYQNGNRTALRCLHKR